MLKIYVGIEDYEPWSGAVETWDKIQDANLEDDFESLIEEMYPDGLTMTHLNDILWFEPEGVLESLGIETEEDA